MSRVQHCPERWQHGAHEFLFCGEPRWCSGEMQSIHPTGGPHA